MPEAMSQIQGNDVAGPLGEMALDDSSVARTQGEMNGGPSGEMPLDHESEVLT